MLVVKGNLANTYAALGRHEEALPLIQEVYSGRLRLHGEDRYTVTAAICYASTLNHLERLEEAKALLRKTTPVARRVLGYSHELTLRLRADYAEALYKNPAATLD